jgi:hypothetical protein
MFSFLMSSPSRSGGMGGMHGFRLYPPSLKRRRRAPEHWPEQVGRAWVQAHNSIDTKSWDYFLVYSFDLPKEIADYKAAERASRSPPRAEAARLNPVVTPS